MYSYKHLVFIVLHMVQSLILQFSFRVCKLINIRKPSDESVLVIGVLETASMLHNISEALPNSVSVNLELAPYYYNYSYTYDLSKMRYFRFFCSPALLGYLASKYDKFLYVSSSGYLIHQLDGREYEFSFLKQENKKIICYFVGSEIRSFKLLNEYAAQKNIDVITTYQGMVNKGIDSDQREKLREKLAKVADKYADKILCPSIDQMSYIKSKTYGCLYFFPDEKILEIPKKWNKIQELIVVHGPTSPIIKGTPIVRAAIKKLQLEGYRFKYVELIGVNHLQVLDVLKSAHIVLNQFYAFVPGVFGVEAMANNCVLLTSADSEMEPTLPVDANSAWIVTKYWQLYDNLKYALDNPESLKVQADYGTAWTRQHCSFSVTGRTLKDIISD